MASRERYDIGVIGGSGLYELDDAKTIETLSVRTPYGEPSDNIVGAELEGVPFPVAFLSRHGKGHILPPSNVPYRANIFALKSIGITKILSLSAVGSLRSGLKPEDFVLPDQLIDRTFLRRPTFFESGLVGHISFAKPFCNQLQQKLYKTLLEASKNDQDIRVVDSGTYVCIEGPAFSTQAESNLYRQWGADIVGMTAIPEAKLAREADICYALLGMVTDYDCWKQNEDAVNAEGALIHMSRNLNRLKTFLADLVRSMSDLKTCEHQNNVQQALVTNKNSIPKATKEQLKVLYEKYF